MDDDNVLQRDYLEAASRISTSHPYLGVFGGSIEAEFEIEPDPRVHSLLHSLAIRPVTGAKWVNFGFGSVPLGAGLCVRAKVARTPMQPIQAARRLGGTWIVEVVAWWEAETLTWPWLPTIWGMGVGLFGELVVTHLIDKRRLSPQYLRRICVGGNYSSHLVTYLHTGIAPRYRGVKGFVIDSLKRLVRTCLGRSWSPAEKAIQEAERRAARDIRFLRMRRKVEIQ